MLILQGFYYAIALILIVFTTFVAGKHPAPGEIFDWRNVRGDVTTGWTLALCWMLDALVTYVVASVTLHPEVVLLILSYSVIPLLLLIARSKLVPDFALTIHFIHLIVTSLYTHHVPDTVAWWALQICSVALMCGLGIWACQWRELRPMVFGGGSSTKNQAEGSQANGHAPEDLEAGHEMGSGRGTGPDGSGSYEMVGMGSSSREPA